MSDPAPHADRVRERLANLATGTEEATMVGPAEELTLDHEGAWTIIRFVDDADGLRFGDARLLLPADGQPQVSVCCDPVDPSRIRSLWVRDAAMAMVTVDSVLGDGAAESLGAQAELGPLDELGGPASPGPQAAALCRLAFATWYEKWTPLNIPEAELVLDVGVAAHGAGEVGIASNAFDRSVDHLGGLADHFAGSAPSALTVALQAAISAARASLGPNHPQDSRLKDSASGLLRNRSAAGSSVPAEWLFPPQAGPGSQAGDSAAGVTDPGWRYRAVDWDMVPPRLVDSSEDAVRWSTTRDRCHVEVRAHPQLLPGSTAASLLMVRLCNRDGEPTASSFLTYDGGTGVFRAELDLSDLDPDSVDWLVPDVFSADVVGAAATGNLAEEKQHLRWVTRSLCSARLALALRELGDDDLAAHWWTTAQEQAIGRRWTWLEEQAAPPATGVLGPERLGLVVPGAEGSARQTLLSELLAAHRETLRVRAENQATPANPLADWEGADVVEAFEILLVYAAEEALTKIDRGTGEGRTSSGSGAEYLFTDQAGTTTVRVLQLTPHEVSLVLETPEAGDYSLEIEIPGRRPLHLVAKGIRAGVDEEITLEAQINASEIQSTRIRVRRVGEPDDR